MSLIPTINELAQESYQQYEKLTNNIIPRNPDGTLFKNAARNNEVDAFRHAYVMGRLAMDYPSSAVKKIGINYENEHPSSQDEHDMDLWNNSIGIKLGAISTSKDDLAQRVKDALERGDLITSPRLITPAEREEVSGIYKELLSDIVAFGNSGLSFIVQAMLQNLSAAESQILVRRSDPLVLDLDGNGEVDLVSISESKVFFDLDNDGFKEQVGWVSGVDGILALDANGNGVVDNIDELFGERLVSGSVVTGTEELRRDWDSNGDGRIDVGDSGNIYNRLLVWKDVNGDGVSQASELSGLVQNGVKAINLNTVVSGQNVNGNVILSEGSFVKLDGSEGKLANLDLAINQANSVSYVYVDNGGNIVGDYDLDLRTIFLPLSRGYGNVKSWHVAMSEDLVLMNLMEDIVNLGDGVNFQNLDQKIEEFIYRWTKTDGINSSDKRGEFSAKKLAVLEKVRGEVYTDSTGSHDVAPWQTALVQSAWDNLVNEVKSKILIQGTFRELFLDVGVGVGADSGDLVSYDFSSDQIIFSDNFNQTQFLENINNYHQNIPNVTDQYIFLYNLKKLSSYFQNKITAFNQAEFQNHLSIDFNFKIDQILFGDDQDNEIQGKSGSDLIIGSKGNDNLFGSYGDDIYVYNKNDGNDIIIENGNKADLDKINNIWR